MAHWEAPSGHKKRCNADNLAARPRGPKWELPETRYLHSRWAVEDFQKGPDQPMDPPDTEEYVLLFVLPCNVFSSSHFCSSLVRPPPGTSTPPRCGGTATSSSAARSSSPRPTSTRRCALFTFCVCSIFCTWHSIFFPVCSGDTAGQGDAARGPAPEAHHVAAHHEQQPDHQADARVHADVHAQDGMCFCPSLSVLLP